MLAIAEVRVKRGSAWMRVHGFGPRLGLHHPAEGDRVALGHVRAHDEDAVGVLQVQRERGGPAAAIRSAQTGHGRAVSYPGLVFEETTPRARISLAWT